jgi:hypothetical protein
MHGSGSGVNDRPGEQQQAPRRARPGEDDLLRGRWQPAPPPLPSPLSQTDCRSPYRHPHARRARIIALGRDDLGTITGRTPAVLGLDVLGVSRPSGAAARWIVLDTRPPAGDFP